jgi:putative thioredoxin
MTLVYDVDTASFATAVIERSHAVPVIVDFWAEWCGPCKVLGPIIEKAVIEAGGDVELAKLDVDQNQQLAGQFGIQGIPTVIAFKDGQPADRFTGALPEDQVREWIDRLRPSEADLAVRQAEQLIDAGDLGAAQKVLESILDQDPGHLDAGVIYAGLLIDNGLAEHALAVLARLAPTVEVEQLQAAARMASADDIDIDAMRAAVAADPSDTAARLALARAQAARGDVQTGLDELLAIVETKGEDSDEARKAMLDIFELRGQDDDLVKSYRAKLASALF